jgi:hypothetical protein
MRCTNAASSCRSTEQAGVPAPLFLDVISPSTDTAALGRRHLDDPASPLGRMMRDLGASALGQLSPMIPVWPKWPLVYRDLCEWAVLYDLVGHERWGSDTLIIRDGLLRTRIFAGGSSSTTRASSPRGSHGASR